MKHDVFVSYSTQDKDTIIDGRDADGTSGLTSWLPDAGDSATFGFDNLDNTNTLVHQ
jgi:hypothetical protein